MTDIELVKCLICNGISATINERDGIEYSDCVACGSSIPLTRSSRPVDELIRTIQALTEVKVMGEVFHDH